MYKITPQISAVDSRQLDENVITGSNALQYNPATKDFSLVPTGGEDFIHKWSVFVDPNGNDTTGEFGNANKPFRTPIAAAYAAALYMDANPIPVIPSFRDGIFPVEVAPFTIVTVPVNKAVIFINIEIATGLYNYETDLAWIAANLTEDIQVNLMYNFINYNLQPGAIMIGYTFDDSWNHFDSNVSVPVVCSVSGNGTWVKIQAVQTDILINELSSRFIFEADYSSLDLYMASKAYIKYTVKLLIVETVNFWNAGMEAGICEIYAENVRTRYEYQSGYTEFLGFWYQGGGTLNLHIDNYYGHLIPYDVDPNVYLYPSLTWSEAGASSGNSWYERFYKDTDNTQGGLPLGYWEEFDPVNNPTIANIHIKNGVIASAASNVNILEVGSGIVNFYPENIKILYDDASEATSLTAIRANGPYYNDAVSKLSVYGGKIELYRGGTGSFFAYANAAIFINDDPQLYIKDTQFVFSSNLYSASGIRLSGTPTQAEQIGSIILDGVKFFTGATSVSKLHTFSMDTVSNIDVKIYNNCFSNMNPIGASGGSYTNLIPGTALIIDSNIQVI